MKQWSPLAVALVLAWTVNLAGAADYDGSKTLICANLGAVECASDSTACIRTIASGIGAPTFIRIDFEGKQIVGPRRTTPIVRMERSARQLLLQGSELDFGWTVALDTADGRLTATLVDRDGVIALFGACTPP